MDKELLINELTISLADYVNIPIQELKEKLSSALSDYSINKLQTTLPSTGDGTTPTVVMSLMGHASMEMTNRYTKITAEQLHDAMKRAI